MTFYQAVNEIRKKNSGEFLYLNPYFCDNKDKLVLFCDISKIHNLPDDFQILDSKLIDTSVNPNRIYEIRSLDILKNIEANSEYRVFPNFNSESKISTSVKDMIDEIKKLNVEIVDGVFKDIILLYDEDRNTFVCNKDLKSLKLPKNFIKLGDSLIKDESNQYGFAYCNPLKITNYSSYIYPNIPSNKIINNIYEFFDLVKLLNPNCKMGLDNSKLCSTIQINDLVLPDGYYVNDLGSIYCIDDGRFVCDVYTINEKVLEDKIDSEEIEPIKANVFSEMNTAKKHKVYELDADGNFIYENGKRKTREGTLQESIDSLKKARSALISKKEAATRESMEKSDIMINAFFNGRELAKANNEVEYERIKNENNTKINSYSVGDVNRIKYELALSEFEKGYKFDENKKIIEKRNKHIIKKKVYTGKSENILVASAMMVGAGMALFKNENPAAFFEYEETEKFKKAKDNKPGFIARGCKKLLEKVKFYINNFEDYSFVDEGVDINAYAR